MFALNSGLMQMIVQPYLPAYIAAWVASTAWMSAVTMTLGHIPFALTVFALNTVAFIVSLILRRRVEVEGFGQVWTRILYPSILLRALGVVFFILPGLADVVPFTYLFPADARLTHELVIGVLFVWLQLLFAFTLVSEGFLLFCSVFGVTVFGLMGTVNINPGLMVAFLVFLLGNLFLLGYVTLLQHTGGRLPAPPAKGQEWSKGKRLRRLTLDQFILAVVMLVMAGIGGGILSRALPLVSPRIFNFALARMARIDWYVQYLNYSGFLPEFRLGAGPVYLSALPVMTVKCDRPLLWRATVYDEYTGRAWRRKYYRVWPVKPRGKKSGKFVFQAYQQRLKKVAPRPLVKQTFHMEMVMPSVLFAAADPIEVSQLDYGRLRADSFGCVQSNMMLPKDEEYTVISAVPAYTPEQLRSASTNYPPRLREIYLDLPLGTEQVQQLARRITAGLSTPYDRAVAIKRYLEENYIYQEVERIPPGVDAATHFLFRSRRGVCDMFATAMALMARSVGIPARVATGFIPGRYDPEQRGYVVTQKDAHAWAELYFPGYGWIPFDPQAEQVGFMGPLIALFSGRTPLFRVRTKQVLFLGTLLLLLGWFGMNLMRLVHRPTLSYRRPLPHDYRGRVVWLYLQLTHQLSRQGYPRRPAQTPQEYVATLAGQFRPVPPSWWEDLLALTQLFLRVRYSPRPVTAADWHQARRLQKAFWEQWRTWQRQERRERKRKMRERRFTR